MNIQPDNNDNLSPEEYARRLKAGDEILYLPRPPPSSASPMGRCATTATSASGPAASATAATSPTGRPTSSCGWPRRPPSRRAVQTAHMRSPVHRSADRARPDRRSREAR